MGLYPDPWSQQNQFQGLGGVGSIAAQQQMTALAKALGQSALGAYGPPPKPETNARSEKRYNSFHDELRHETCEWLHDAL
jgi:hypothetical protein